MPRILLDENVPAIVQTLLTSHDVRTVHEMAWSILSNAALIAAAEVAGFAILVTADQNIRRQQNHKHLKLAFVILGTNHWLSIRDNANALVAAVNQAKEDRFQAMPLDRLAGKTRRRITSRR